MQEILVGGEVMMAAILIIFSLLFIGAMGFLFVIFIHLSIKKNSEEGEWLDNGEYDYGHDVRYNETDNF